LIDPDELGHVLNRIGFHVSRERIQDIVDLYDLDGQGTIGFDEFIGFLHAQQKESSHRIKELCEAPMIALESSGKKFVPPYKGILQMSVVDGYTRKSEFQTLSDCDKKSAVDMAKNIGDICKN